ncbi:MAG: hypothetical protein CML60_10690 [Rhodobacteraceae bacterium]|nr:hypothetical protein [Paracoccaceae bacterium]
MLYLGKFMIVQNGNQVMFALDNKHADSTYVPNLNLPVINVQKLMWRFPTLNSQKRLLAVTYYKRRGTISDVVL